MFLCAIDYSKITAQIAVKTVERQQKTNETNKNKKKIKTNETLTNPSGTCVFHLVDVIKFKREIKKKMKEES